MYYYPSASSRAATILLWGRLATCGRLAIGLPLPPENLPAPMVVVCGLPLCGAGNPACSRLSGGFASLRRPHLVIQSKRSASIGFTLAPRRAGIEHAADSPHISQSQTQPLLQNHASPPPRCAPSAMCLSTAIVMAHIGHSPPPRRPQKQPDGPMNKPPHGAPRERADVIGSSLQKSSRRDAWPTRLPPDP
jgi:hypothetical protein